MLFACGYCGGTLEPAIIAIIVAAWGYGCYLLSRVFWFVKCGHKSTVTRTEQYGSLTVVSQHCCDCGETRFDTENHLAVVPASEN